MALGTALVDRAVIVRQVASTERVEGTTLLAPVRSEVFKCRLFVPLASEGPDESRGYRRAMSYPQMLFAKADLRGDPVTLLFNDQVEITSKEQGGLTRWKVNGEPQPLRRKRSVLGFLVNLERSIEREFTPRDV